MLDPLARRRSRQGMEPFQELSVVANDAERNSPLRSNGCSEGSNYSLYVYDTGWIVLEPASSSRLWS